jgi:hypothetical protein
MLLFSSYFRLEVRLGDLGQSMFHLACRERVIREMLKLPNGDYGARGFLGAVCCAETASIARWRLLLQR